MRLPSMRRLTVNRGIQGIVRSQSMPDSFPYRTALGLRLRFARFFAPSERKVHEQAEVFRCPSQSTGFDHPTVPTAISVGRYLAHPLDFGSLNRGFLKLTGTFRTRNSKTPGRSYGTARSSRGDRQASRAIDGMGKTTLIGGGEEL